MKSNYKVILSWGIVFLWMIVIFLLSGTPAKQSTKESRGIIRGFIESGVKTTNYLGITDKHPNESNITKYVKRVDPIFRKCMHASVYFILALLVFNACYQTGIRGWKLYIYAITFSFLYACTDEYHQTFVKGRSGEVKDVLIDTLGSIFSMFLAYCCSRIKKKSS